MEKRGTAHLRALGVLFTLPALLFITFTTVVPILWNLALSFTSWNGNSSLQADGLANYMHAFSDSDTLLGFRNSILISAASTLIAILSGFILALLIYRMGRREGAFYRFVFFTPSMTPFTVIGLLFVFILSPDTGLLNSLLGIFGLNSLQHAWLGEPQTVLWCISIIGGWRFTGIVMMLFYTAVTSIPPSMFEAGRIDGAGYFKQVRIIILPLIKPTVQLTVMMVLMWSFKTYDVVWTMTKGGPGNVSKTVPIRMLEVGFQYNQFGYAAAIGVLLTILVSVSILAVQRLTRGDRYEY